MPYKDERAERHTNTDGMRAFKPKPVETDEEVVWPTLDDYAKGRVAPTTPVKGTKKEAP
jgi:hypothetical protein